MINRRLMSLVFTLGAATLFVPTPAAKAHDIFPSFAEISCSVVSGLSITEQRNGTRNQVRLQGSSGSAVVPPGAVRAIWIGDVIRISAQGTIHAGGFLGLAGAHSPDGTLETAPDWRWPLPGAPKFSLVARFNDTTQAPVFVGRGPRCFQWLGTNDHRSLHDATFLWLTFNDDWPSDNSQFFDIAVDSFWCGLPGEIGPGLRNDC
jgi:hypothetical protein